MMGILFAFYVYKTIEIGASTWAPYVVENGGKYFLIAQNDTSIYLISLSSSGDILTSQRISFSASTGTVRGIDYVSDKPIIFGDGFYIVGDSVYYTPGFEFSDVVHLPGKDYIVGHNSLNYAMFFNLSDSIISVLTSSPDIKDIKAKFYNGSLYMGVAYDSTFVEIQKLSPGFDTLYGRVKFILPDSAYGVYLDAYDRFIAVGFTIDSSAGFSVYKHWAVLLLDTANLNAIRSFKIYPSCCPGSHHYLTGLKFINGKIFLYGRASSPASYPTFAVIDTLGNVLKFVRDTSFILAHVVFFNPLGNVIIMHSDTQFVFVKTDTSFLEPCNMGIVSATVTTMPVYPYYLTSSSMFRDTSPVIPSSSPDVFSASLTSNTLCFIMTDTSKPRVVLTQPDSGEVNVPLSANIGVWFSKPMDTTTINNTSVIIRGWDGSSLRNYNFTRTCPLSMFCVLDPYPDFRPNELVYVRFTSLIRDTAGNDLIPKTITFRTQTVDTSNPVIVFTTPDSGEINVPANTNIGVQFSKEMDTTTINNATVRIVGSSSGGHTFTKSCPTLDYCVLNPDADFAPSEVVEVEFRSGIMGLNGKNLVPKVITFTTGSVDGIPPTITILPNDTITIYDRSVPIRAHISDDRGVQRVEWDFNSQIYTSFTNCRNTPFNNPDTACFYIPDVPTDTFLLRAYGFDYSGNTSYDSAWVIYLDTVRPYITYTEPNDGAVGVSPTPSITIIFSEDMDTSVWGYLKVLVNTSEYSYTRSWQDRKTLKVNPTVMLPYDSTVKVVVDSFVDLSGNMMVRDSFRFTVVSNATVEVIITQLNPDSVYKNSPDSTYIEAVISSRYAIRSAEAVVDGSIKYSMLPKDGAFDSPVETVYVRIRFGEFDVGDHSVIVRGYNDYTYGESQVKTVRVLDIKFLSGDNVIIYPNPAKGKAKLRVVFGGDAYATIEVFDLKARKVYSKSQNFKGYTKHEIELPELPVGVYLLRIRANDEKVEKWFSVIK